MPGRGVQIGSSYYEMTAETRDLLAKMAQAEAATKKTYAEIARASGTSAAAVERAHKQMTASSQASSAGFGSLTKSAVGFGIAAIGIGSASAIAAKAISSVAESTKNAAQAQFAMSKTFGSSTGEMVAFSKSFADSIGRSNTEVQQSAVLVGNLTKEYGLSNAQARMLIVVAADLAAKFGKDLPDAVQRLQAAIRGEAESAEALGLVLNDDAVAVRQLGQEHKNLWQKLTDSEKAQLRLAEATRQLGEAQGAASERAASALGAFDRLGKVSDELGAALGQRLLPVVGAIADYLSLMGQGGIAALDAFNDLSRMDLNRLAQIANLLFPAAIVASRLTGIKLPGGDPGQAREDAAEAKRQQDREIAAQENANRVSRIKATAAERDELERRKEAADDRLEVEKEAIAKERQAKVDWFNEERQRIEARRNREIKDIEVRRDAALRALEVGHDAAVEENKQRIEAAERQKDAELEAADAAYDQLKRAIDARKQALEGIRTLEDRDRESSRRSEDQALSDARDRADAEVEIQEQALRRIREVQDRERQDRRQAEDQALADSRQAADAARDAERTEEDRSLAEARTREDRRLEARAHRLAQQRELEDRARSASREAEDRDIAARRTAQDRALEAEHDTTLAQLEEAHKARLADIATEIDAVEARKEAALRALDEQANRERASAEQASRALDARYEAESRARDAAHEQTLRAFDDEADAARRANDDRLRGIDALAEAEGERHRQVMAGLEAEKDARLAEIDAALGLLDAQDAAEQRAARASNLQNTVANARLGVTRAESTGNYSEILKAQQELADAEQALRDEGVRNDRDAQREILRERQRTINEELAARGRAEDEAHRLAGAQLDDTRETAQQALEVELARIAARRQAEQDAEDDAKQAAKDVYEATKQAADDALAAQLDAIDRRRQAITDETDAALEKLQIRQEAEQDAYQRDVDRINTAYELTRTRIADQRAAEDQARDDRRTKEDQDRSDRRTREDTQLSETKTRLQDRRTAEDQDRKDRRTAEDQEIKVSRESQDRRRAEERLAQDRYRTDERTAEDAQAKATADRVTSQRVAEDRARDDRRTKEDQDRKDRRTAEDLALAAQLGAGEVTRETERRQIAAHYDGPNGVLSILKQRTKQIDDEYKERVRLAGIQYQAELDKAKMVYENDNGDGLLQNLEKAKDATMRTLKDQEDNWEKWRKSVVKDIEAATKALDAYAEAARRVPGGVGPVLPPGAGGGTGRPGTGTGGLNIPNPPDADVGRFIQQVAPQYGIPAADALAVWSGEGRSGYVGDGGTSFGPYQLHTPGGLGDQFERETRLSLRDPNTWQQQVLWAMGYVQRYGWNNQWHGAPANLKDKKYRDAGYLFREPTLTYGLRSGERNMIAEQRPELLLGGAATGQMLRPSALSVPAGAMNPYGDGGSERLMGVAGRWGEPMQQRDVYVTLGDVTLAKLVVRGMRLELSRSGTLPGIAS